MIIFQLNKMAGRHGRPFHSNLERELSRNGYARFLAMAHQVSDAEERPCEEQV